MARLAGLRLRHRWASFAREPFTDESPAHVSVWEKPADSLGSHDSPPSRSAG